MICEEKYQWALWFVIETRAVLWWGSWIRFYALRQLRLRSKIFLLGMNDSSKPRNVSSARSWRNSDYEATRSVLLFYVKPSCCRRSGELGFRFILVRAIVDVLRYTISHRNQLWAVLINAKYSRLSDNWMMGVASWGRTVIGLLKGGWWGGGRCTPYKNELRLLYPHAA